MSEGKAFKSFRLGEESLKGPFASIAEDACGAVWVASSEAVFRRAPPQSFVQVKKADGQSIKGTAALQADRDGSMWLASSDNGLLRWRNGQLTQLDLAHGSAFNAVRSIVEDNDGYFWMTAQHSVVRVRVTDLRAVADGEMSRLIYDLFDYSDGLPKAEFPNRRQPASMRDRLGRLWFATTKGVAMIDPSTLRLNDVPPPVHLEDISFYLPQSVVTNTDWAQASSHEVQVHMSGPFAGPLSLPAGSRRIEIRYAGLSLTAPEKVRFQVKLDGLDSDWRDAQNTRMQQFQELAPRDYVFHVRASNNDGVWNETGAALAFSVLPYYWQTSWFRIGIGVLLIAFGAMATWMQSQRRVRRALERERAASKIRELTGRLINEQEQERARLARELHDDITQRLARLAIDVGRWDPARSRQVAQQTKQEVLSGLVQLSEDVHALSYRLHPAIIEVVGLTEALRAETERFQRQDGVGVKLNLCELRPSVPCDLSLCIFRVAQEALQNIARHAAAREVELSLHAAQDGLQLVVRDDGCGFDLANHVDRPSLGLGSMQERVISRGGRLDIESRPGHGTRIAAWVPWNKAEG
jgi:signal transduction histidine kinase